MPAACRICSHPQRDAIDAALVSKTPREQIMVRFGVKRDTLRRHLYKHIGALVKSESKPWDRRPGERPRQWEGFETYLRLCTEHLDRDVTFAEVARLLGRSPELIRQWAF